MFAEDKWHESEKIIMDNGDKHENSLICTFKLYGTWERIYHWKSIEEEIERVRERERSKSTSTELHFLA